MLKKLLFAVMLLPLLTSCIKKPLMAGIDAPPLDVTSVLHTDFSPEKYLFVKELSARGKTVFFYQDHEGYTHYYNGTDDRIINREVMDKYKKLGAVPLNMSYGYDGKYVYFSQPAKWEQKKLIFIKLEQNGDVVYTKELSSLGQVITSASMAFDEKGGVLLTWIDETAPNIKAVYTVIREDGSSGQEEVVAYPDKTVLFARAVNTDKGLAVIYSRTELSEIFKDTTRAGITEENRKETRKETKKDTTSTKLGEIRIRFLSDGSEKTLYSGKAYDADLIAGKGVFLIRPYEESVNIKLITFSSSFEKIKEYSIEKPAEIGAAFSPFIDGVFFEKEPFVVGIGSPPNSVLVEGRSLPQKPNLFYSHSGKNYERFVGGRPFMFTSEVPSVDSSEKYTVVAYNDRRSLSPLVMLAVFGRGGKLIKSDLLIEKPGSYTGSPRVAHLGGDVFRVFYPIQDKEAKVWRYRAIDISADNIENLYEFPTAKGKLSLLTETVEKYANCRKTDDYGCVYDMLDPAYKATKSKAVHEEMMKAIGATMLDFRLENCKLLDDSLFGVCDGYLKAKLPEEIKGAKLSSRIKENERIVEQDMKGELWIYIDGKWYYGVNVPMLGYGLKW